MAVATGLFPLAAGAWRHVRAGGGIRPWDVALPTDCIYIGFEEQVRIRAAVAGVTCSAAFGLHGGMLVDERTGDVDVALRAGFGLVIAGIQWKAARLQTSLQRRYERSWAALALVAGAAGNGRP